MCLSCICGVNSNDGQPGCGPQYDGPTSGCPPGCFRNSGNKRCFCGPYHLSARHFDECRRGPGWLSKKIWHECANNAKCARACMMNIIWRLRRSCTEVKNATLTPCFDYARLHKGLKKECKKKWTTFFAKKVAKCCSML